MAERTERRNHGSTDHLLLLSLPLLRSFSLVRSRCPGRVHCACFEFGLRSSSIDLCSLLSSRASTPIAWQTKRGALPDQIVHCASRFDSLPTLHNLELSPLILRTDLSSPTMSASPEPKVGSPAASADHDETEKVATPVAGNDEGNEEPANVGGDDADNEPEISDDESILSEVDEAQFENFDPENVEVEDRPQLAIDEENLKLIGRHKRKRAEGEEGRSRRKEGRREKKRRGGDEEDEGEGGAGPSRRREGKKKKKAAEPDTDEETMDPETRT